MNDQDKKEILNNLLEEGQTVLNSIKTLDDHNYKVWMEKLRVSIRKIYGETSAEYKEITHVNLASYMMTTETTEAELVDREKDGIRKKLAKLEAWISVI